MTFEVILYFMKNLYLYNISIHGNLYQNLFINEYARKKKAKISESRSPGVPESRSFLVRYRRTYVLKNWAFRICLYKFIPPLTRLNQFTREWDNVMIEDLIYNLQTGFYQFLPSLTRINQFT